MVICWCCYLCLNSCFCLFVLMEIKKKRKGAVFMSLTLSIGVFRCPQYLIRFQNEKHCKEIGETHVYNSHALQVSLNCQIRAVMEAQDGSFPTSHFGDSCETYHSCLQLAQSSFGQNLMGVFHILALFYMAQCCVLLTLDGSAVPFRR